MRRWSLPARGVSAPTSGGGVEAPDSGDGDVEMATTNRSGIHRGRQDFRRRSTTAVGEVDAATAAATAAAYAEEELRLAIIYAQLDEAFGLGDLGNFPPLRGELVEDAEVATVATTRTGDSREDEGGVANNAENTRAVDPDTGLALPVATPVGVERDATTEMEWRRCLGAILGATLVLLVASIGCGVIFFVLYMIFV